MDKTCYLSNLASQGSDGWQPQDQGEPQFSTVHCRKQGTTGTTSQEMTESKPERLNLLPNQGARMRPKWQTFHHLCCNGSDFILSLIPIMGSHLVEWPKKGLIMLLTLSVSILDNAYKGQCLSSPP